ncbi:MAG: sigma-70 family RNA polymerase sigma factor [Planctomycetes bacterium]|nr:sigma-70 family RNA polymerase sigma factor [Planctomycetota bacterium]
MIRSDDELFLLYQQKGQADILGKIYDSVAPGLLTLALHLRSDPAQAEDLVHDVFVRAMEDASEWDPATPLSEWLSSFLATGMEGPSFAISGLLELHDLDPAPDSMDPLSQAKVSELQHQLNEAIVRLPEKYQCVIRMGLQEGLDSHAIGMALDRSPGTVRSQLSRGLDRLRQMLPSALGLGIVCRASQGMELAHPFGSNVLRTRVLETLALPKVAPLPSEALAGSKGIQTFTLAALVTGVVGVLALLYSQAPQTAGAGNLPTYPTTQIRVVPQGGAGIETPELAQRQVATGERAATETRESHLFGRVVNHLGVPIAGATITLHSDDPWFGEGLLGESGEEPEWIVSSDDQGYYSLVVPTPKARYVELLVNATDDYSSHHITFAGLGSCAPPLWSGERDLGTATLFPAGSITGRILNHDGTPAYPATVVISPGCDPATGCQQDTDPDGRFIAPNLLLGEHTIRVYQDSRVSSLKGVGLEQGQHVQLPVHFLPLTDLITVQVQGPEGLPVKGAMLAFASGDGAQAAKRDLPRTHASGISETQLAPGEGRTLTVLASGFSPEGPLPLEPGDAHLTIRLKSVPSVGFRAFNPATQQPIPVFYVHVERQNLLGQWQEVDSPRPLDVEAGEARHVSIQEGDRYGVFANGYQEVLGVFEQGAEDVIHIPLTQIPSIVGRVVMNGIPQAHVLIELSAGGLRNGDADQFAAAPELEFEIKDFCVKWTQTDSDGNFEIDSFELQQSHYSLRANLPGVGSTIEWFQVKQGQPNTIRMGDLELEQTGSIQGRVLGPPGLPIGGLAVFLDCPGGSRFAYTDSSGVFEITDVLPGPHRVVVEELRELIPIRSPETLFVKAGETSEFHLDLRSCGRSLRDLEIFLGGNPLVHYKVYLLAPRTGQRPGDPDAEELQAGFIGSTDAQGFVHGELPCGPPVEVWVASPGTDRLTRHGSAMLYLRCDPSPRIHVEFESVSN